ncbi:hypothetical protein K0U27_03825 [archaeon]|nr:hypothetical protein [archaeon]
MKLLTLSLLSIIMIFEVTEAFAGGEAYQNRANEYWMQIYMNIAMVIGIVAAAIITIYKLRKRKMIQ